MIVRIGLVDVARELRVELADDIEPGALASALAVSGEILWIRNGDGADIAVRSDAVAWVELETED
jgi:hypothetical protein